MSPGNAPVTTDVKPKIRATVRDNLTDLQKANAKLYVNRTVAAGGTITFRTSYAATSTSSLILTRQHI